jgi:YfiR/HmsC-like
MKFTDSRNRGLGASIEAGWRRPWSALPGLPAALWIICALGAVSSVLAQTEKPTEYQVKAAYLYNFGKFVQRAPGSGEARTDPFRICVLGRNPFGSALEGLTGQIISGRSVATRAISRPQDAGKCDVLFVGASEQDHLSEILSAIQKQSILTVSDMPHFVARGGMIEFVIQDSKVRFQVNRAAAETAGLSLSSELLKVAVNVKNSP